MLSVDIKPKVSYTEQKVGVAAGGWIWREESWVRKTSIISTSRSTYSHLYKSYPAAFLDPLVGVKASLDNLANFRVISSVGILEKKRSLKPVNVPQQQELQIWRGISDNIGSYQPRVGHSDWNITIPSFKGILCYCRFYSFLIKM